MIRLTLLLLLLNAGPLIAQTATVLSGDHPGFTRLTFPLRGDVDWTMRRTTDGYALQFAKPKTFDLTQVFNKIGRNRLSKIRADDGGLSLTIPCVCAATAFRFRNRHLVIDIRDGPPNPDSPFEQSDVPQGGNAKPGIVVPAGRRLPGRMLLPLAPGTAPVPVAGLGLRPRTLGADDGPKNSVDTAQDIGALEREVVDTLARAASQGLLTLAPDVLANMNEDAAPLKGTEHSIEETPPPPAISSHAPLPEPTPATPGLLAHTSMDTMQTLLDSSRGTTEGGSLCWPESFLEFEASDAPPDRFGDFIGPLRSQVTDDRDKPDAKAVTALARGYLAFGFGQEAIQVLDMDAINDRERVALRSMAHVIDNLKQTAPDLVSQTGCPGPAGLWAALASDDPEGVTPTKADDIVQQFKLLPDILQSQLGPRLADLMRRADLPELANAVLAPAQRQAVAPQSASLVAADLAMDRGDVSLATDVLETMVNEDPRVTPETLVQLIDLQIAQDQIIEPETLSLLETMQFEYRDQPVMGDILRARTAALAYQGNLAAALDLLPQAEAALDPALSASLRDDLVAEIAGKGDDMIFLDVAFRPMGAEVSPEIQNTVASRLLDLGFPDRVLDVLAGPASGSTMAERRFLRARAAMDLDQPELAASTLAGVTTPRAVAILSGRGDKTDADAAWRNGDWASLAVSDDSLLQEAAALAQDRVDPVPDAEAPLASGQALVEDSSKARSTLGTLMSRFAPPS